MADELDEKLAKIGTGGGAAEPSPAIKVVSGIFTGAIVLGVVMLWRSCANAPPPQLSESDRQAMWLEKGQDAVRAKLKDGDSAKFRGVFFHRSRNGIGIPAACGEVNSKNSFGAYGGFQQFISAGSADTTYLREQMSENDWAKLWIEICADVAAVPPPARAPTKGKTKKSD